MLSVGTKIVIFLSFMFYWGLKNTHNLKSNNILQAQNSAIVGRFSLIRFQNIIKRLPFTSSPHMSSSFRRQGENILGLQKGMA
jgi:hypothetical protein